MEDRREWEHATEHSRHLAVAADAELRRRHPDQQIEPLRSKDIGQVAQRIQGLAGQRKAFCKSSENARDS